MTEPFVLGTWARGAAGGRGPGAKSTVPGAGPGSGAPGAGDGAAEQVGRAGVKWQRYV